MNLASLLSPSVRDEVEPPTVQLARSTVMEYKTTYDHRCNDYDKVKQERDMLAKQAEECLKLQAEFDHLEDTKRQREFELGQKKLDLEKATAVADAEHRITQKVAEDERKGHQNRSEKLRCLSQEVARQKDRIEDIKKAIAAVKREIELERAQALQEEEERRALWGKEDSYDQLMAQARLLPCDDLNSEEWDAKCRAWEREREGLLATSDELRDRLREQQERANQIEEAFQREMDAMKAKMGEHHQHILKKLAQDRDVLNERYSKEKGERVGAIKAVAYEDRRKLFHMRRHAAFLLAHLNERRLMKGAFHKLLGYRLHSIEDRKFRHRRDTIYQEVGRMRHRLLVPFARRYMNKLAAHAQYRRSTRDQRFEELREDCAKTVLRPYYQRWFEWNLHRKEERKHSLWLANCLETTNKNRNHALIYFQKWAVWAARQREEARIREIGMRLRTYYGEWQEKRTQSLCQAVAEQRNEAQAVGEECNKFHHKLLVQEAQAEEEMRARAYAMQLIQTKAIQMAQDTENKSIEMRLRAQAEASHYPPPAPPPPMPPTLIASTPTALPSPPGLPLRHPGLVPAPVSAGPHPSLPPPPVG